MLDARPTWTEAAPVTAGLAVGTQNGSQVPKSQRAEREGLESWQSQGDRVRGPQILKDSRGIGLEITRRKEHEDKACWPSGYERKALIHRAADKEG